MSISDCADTEETPSCPLFLDRKLSDSRAPWVSIALIAWGAAVLAVAIRLLHLRHRGTTFDCYFNAGLAWRGGKPVYTSDIGMGFVYSPLIAAYFSAYTFLPRWVGAILWLFTNAALLVGGLYAVLSEGIFCIASERAKALVLVLAIPLSLASLDVAQANPALIGLLLIAVVAASREQWTLCALLIGIATYLKIYPVALGLVLCVYKPGKLVWRLGLALFVFAGVSFLLQQPRYVLEQYHDWFISRTADDRRLWSISHAPLDLWFMLVRVGRLPISEHAYTALQIGSGTAIAGYCWLAQRQPNKFRLAGVFLLCSSWMILLGPATESFTYAILAPGLCLGLVAAFCTPASRMTRSFVLFAFVLLLTAQIHSSFCVGWHRMAFRTARPVAALSFLAFTILWLRETASKPSMLASYTNDPASKSSFSCCPSEDKGGSQCIW